MKPIQHGKYYHIYNRGNNREDLFRSPDNYQHFLRLYEKHILPVAETFAWVLMKNHFHILVRVKEEEEIGFLPLIDTSRFANPGRSEQKTFQGQQTWKSQKLQPNQEVSNSPRKFIPSRQFGHLFNAYTKYYNNLNNRSGSLFEKNFHRIEVTSDIYFKHLIVYIHTNPVHHGFTENFKDYPWSSYGTILSLKPTKLCREKVIGWFDDKANFIEVHNKKNDLELISHLLLE